MFKKLWRDIVFTVGDLRGKPRVPYFGFENGDPSIPYEDGFEALRLLKAGDVGLHREYFCASNVFIPGFMKHAWIHINDAGTDPTKTEIVEAVSKGVVRRSALYPIIAKHTIILRPKLHKVIVDHAIEKAVQIVGCEYDDDFDFDVEEELQDYGHMPNEEKDELRTLSRNISIGHNNKFSCTEIVSFCYWHARSMLKLYRVHARGKDVVLADQMINNGFDIVWMSKDVNVDFAAKKGLGEEGCEMIKSYINSH
jgi:hypothetical protein